MEAGRELDALVAEKVMGWRRPIDPGGAWFDSEGYVRTIEPTSFGSFQPSTDIAAAWEVVEKMVEYLRERNPLAGRSGGFIFSLSRYGTDTWGACIPVHWPAPMAYADAAPPAICLAALKAKGIVVE